jgi:ornithine cyclodeaminase
LALLGTGKQAFAQAHAVSLVRPIETIRLFGRDQERRHGLAVRLADELGVRVSEHGDAREAIGEADVVTAITRSAEPFVTGAMLRPGQHVNAVGAIVPSRRELDASAVARCAVVVSDSVVQARDDAGELRAAVEVGGLDWHEVHGLAEVVDRPLDALRGPRDISLFKALGVGLSDVALGAEVARRAQEAGAGSPLPRPTAAHH